MAETTKWEYQALTVGGALSGPKDDELAAILNEWGEEGWEVMGVMPIENSNKVRIVAKRPLRGATHRQRTWPGL